MLPARYRALLLPLAAACACALAYWAFWESQFNGFILNLGSINMPTHRWLVMAALLAFLGLPMAAFVAVAGARWVTDEQLASWRTAWREYPDRRSVMLAAVLGALIPLAVQASVLRYSPVVDDEASYQFAAELLASFRLWVPAPPMKLFFDNGFMVINDGKMYSQYFLGWPFLMAFGVKLGMPWLVNPVLSGATAVGLFLLARRWWGSGWGRVAVALYLVSPLTMIGAATLMSHTSAIFALTWMLYWVERLQDSQRPHAASAWVALFFCLAFWIRPAVGLGLGAPFLVLWCVRAWRLSGVERWKQALLFVLVALPLGGLFLLTNHELNGSPWLTGYHAAARYAEENGYRFVSFGPSQVQRDSFLYFFTDTSWVLATGRMVLALFRLSVDGFGWPLGFLFVFLARGAPARWLVAGLVSFCVIHLPVADPGVDTFGPVHYSELMLPTVLLSTGGLRTLWQWASERALGAVVPAALVGLVCVCVTMFLPPRIITLRKLVADVLRPRYIVERDVPENSVVFVPPGFAPPCRSAPANHFVFFRKNNHPDRDDPILWLNHVSVERDRQFLQSVYPQRSGFLMSVGRDCVPRIVPLESASPSMFPPTVKERPGDFPEEAP
ncbi:ArnT family glycosyltransferase [Myxococcus faecalis]|uniref:ArnT family glycosyltransferase n=1 Tax=Myxococcus faecalis TaxID=3115646 RepID=UPI0024C74C67|nr:glycosyltransferase family 39 protein [Myxococcus sp. MH1]